MTRRIIILLVSIILGLPFWWGMNILAKDVENFCFLQEITTNPRMLSAQINQQFLDKQLKNLKQKKLRAENFKNLKINARAAISAEIDNKGNEEILFEQNSEKFLPIASISKLMTALVVFDLKQTYNFSQIITISKEAVEQEGNSKWGSLKEGEKMSVENLLYMMLIESDNDAAFALTEPIGEEGFVGLMNINAENLGLDSTRFFNPTGLEPDDPTKSINYSTARDLVKLAKYILERYPQIFEVTDNQSYSVLRPNGAFHHFIPENTNKLLEKVPEIIGGKTGWAPAASGCLLIIMKEPKRDGYFVNVVLGTNDRFGEMQKIIDALNEN